MIEELLSLAPGLFELDAKNKLVAHNARHHEKHLEKVPVVFEGFLKRAPCWKCNSHIFQNKYSENILEIRVCVFKGVFFVLFVSCVYVLTRHAFRPF